MFNNPGGKLKGLAKVVFWIEIISFSITGLATMFTGGLLTRSLYSYGYGSYSSSISFASVLAGLLIIGFGVLLAWISSIGLYAFGELVESNDKILQIVSVNRGTPAAPTYSAPQTPAYTAPTYSAPQAQAYTAPAANITICPKCGKAVAPGVRFCTSCGSSLQ